MIIHRRSLDYLGGGGVGAGGKVQNIGWFGGGARGPNSQQAHDVATTSQQVVMTSM